MPTSDKGDLKRAFIFHPDDWLSEHGLRLCSLAARGLWIDLLCHMGKMPRPGELRHADGRKFSASEVAKLVYAPDQEVSKAMDELVRTGVAATSEDGGLYNRRMVRDESKRLSISNARRQASLLRWEYTVPVALRGLKLYEKDERLCKRWDALYAAAQAAYPGVDLLGELRSAHAWEVANVTRRKKDRARFLNMWWAKAQDRGRGSPGSAAIDAPLSGSESTGAGVTALRAAWRALFTGSYFLQTPGEQLAAQRMLAEGKVTDMQIMEHWKSFKERGRDREPKFKDFLAYIKELRSRDAHLKAQQEADAKFQEAKATADAKRAATPRKPIVALKRPGSLTAEQEAARREVLRQQANSIEKETKP